MAWPESDARNANKQQTGRLFNGRVERESVPGRVFTSPVFRSCPSFIQDPNQALYVFDSRVYGAVRTTSAWNVDDRT